MSKELAKNNYGAAVSQESGFEVEMGSKISTNPVDKYKIGEGARDLMTILTKKPIVTRTHYCEEIGYRFHTIPEAVERGLQTFVHYNFLAIVWNSDKAGSKIIDEEYKLVVVSVAEKVYNRIVTKYELNGDLSKLVLQVSVEKGMEQYQSLMFEVHNQIKPPFLKNKALFGEIREKFVSYKAFVPRAIAGTVTPDEWREKMGGTEAQKAQDDKQFASSGRAVEQATSAAADNEIEDVSFEEVDEPETKPVAKEQKTSAEKAKKEEAKDEATDKSGEFFSEEDVNFD